MKRTLFAFLIILQLSAFAKTASAQTPAPIVAKMLRGRVIGQSLEELEGVTVFNKRDSVKAVSDKRGFFSISVAKSDTLIFSCAKYSNTQYVVKRLSENINVIMISRKADALPANFTVSQFEKAFKEDEKIYDILKKGAERNGMWNY